MAVLYRLAYIIKAQKGRLLRLGFQWSITLTDEILTELVEFARRKCGRAGIRLIFQSKCGQNPVFFNRTLNRYK